MSLRPVTSIAPVAPEPAAAADPAGAPLGELLALPALAGARLVPARADRGLRVRALAPLDPDAEATGVPDTMVVVAGRPPRRPPAGCVVVIATVAPTAGAGGPPVVVLPRDARWSAVLAELGAAVGGSTVAHAEAARRALRAPLLEGEGFAGLAETGAGLLGAGVALVDEHLDLLGAHGLDEARENALAEAVARARAHGPASALGPFLADEMPGVARRRVSGAGGPVGAVAAWIAEPPSPADEATLAELAEASALERAREQVRSETESRLLGDLIDELMAGDAVNRGSLLRRARHLGADLAGGAVAMLGKLSDPHDSGRVIADLRLVRRFLQAARATVALHAPRALVDWSDGRLLALLPPGPAVAVDGDPRERREAVEAQALTVGRRLLVATGQTVPGLALTLAVSRFTPEPERLGVALDEARLALSIGERLGRTGEVVTFEETGTYKLLFQIFADRPEELSSFYEATLAPLVAYDEQYQTELVATLATYLGHDCNLAVTAGTLFTHRHTVRYRLDRIAELSGLDISKTDDREKLSLGLKAMRLLGRRVAAAPEGSGRRGRGGA